MEKQFCKPARRGSRAWNACQNSPCQCSLLYEQAGEQVKDAAPELLKACKHALDKLETIANKLGHVTQGDTETRKTRAMLEKAIAKAEGRAQ